GHLAEVGRRDQALAPITEAVDIRRRLAQANPDAYLPDLAGSLNNLAGHLAEVGRRDQALAPITEAVDIRRRLAQANPDAYLPDLAGSLNNLLSVTAGTAHASVADAAWDDVGRQFRHQPQLVCYLEVERACALLDQDVAEAVGRLIGIERSGQASPRVAGRVRGLLRTAWRRAPTLVERGYGGDLPAWLHLDDELLDACVAWISTRTWQESLDALRQRPDLLSEAAELALDELALLGNETVVAQHRGLLRRARDEWLDAAYRPLLLQDTAYRWVEADTWESSQRFLTEHAELVDDPDAVGVLTALAGDGPNPVVTVHLALLTLARAVGIPEAYGCLTDGGRLDAQVRAAIRDGSPRLLGACATVEAHVHQLPLAGLVHHSIAAALAGQPVTIPAELSILVREADADERNRLASQVVALLRARPDASPTLTPLLAAVLAGPPEPAVLAEPPQPGVLAEPPQRRADE
ncbi:MAG TPA: hypothetical protein VFM55_04365, partial [Micromonosporaceae bacterium]|nr:hypothetical protein [Micromonosporaceae bacterium]